MQNPGRNSRLPNDVRTIDVGMELGVKQSCESQQNNGEFAGSVSIFMEHYPVNNFKRGIKNFLYWKLKFLFNILLLFD